MLILKGELISVYKNKSNEEYSTLVVGTTRLGKLYLTFKTEDFNSEELKSLCGEICSMNVGIKANYNAKTEKTYINYFLNTVPKVGE